MLNNKSKTIWEHELKLCKKFKLEYIDLLVKDKMLVKDKTTKFLDENIGKKP